MPITIKTDEEIEIMGEGGARLARVLRALKKEVKAGIKTKELDILAREYIKKEGCVPSFLNYRPSGARVSFPAALCVSINEEVVHGLPSERVIEEGDLIKLDIGLVHKGFHSDMAITIPVGRMTKDEERLICATREALEKGMRAACLGNTLGDIGAAISARIIRDKLGVVRELVGHGIGRELHENPYVFNVGKPGEGEELLPGMVLAIEPMVALGSGRISQMKDDSFVTADGTKAAHFEHTVAITKKGPRVLTI